MPYKKKLIEVALPLEAINAESVREKSIRHGHPFSLHLWWARRPLATCRAVLFASLVDDPDDPEANPGFVEACKQLEVGPNATLNDTPRMRLFDFIEKLVKWENSNNESILKTAHNLINLACDAGPPPVLDPFCGGGSIPLEAQRLGLEAHSSDLNPVAVLITKALIEIPPKFAGQPPVNSVWQMKSEHEKAAKVWKGAEGLAEDVCYYGKWMRDEAEKRIGQYYPKAKLPDGSETTVIAWIWTRTVICPNPACGCQMPLVRSFQLSKKQGKEAWVVPIIESGNSPTIRFEVRTGKGNVPDGTVNRKGAKCIACGTTVPLKHVRAEGKAGRMDAQLMAIVTEGDRQRIYVEPNNLHVGIAMGAKPGWKPEIDLPINPRDFKTPNYGIKTFGDLFTDRQLLALTTFSDLVGEARERVMADTRRTGSLPTGANSEEQECGLEGRAPDIDGLPLSDGGTGAQAYADAVATYLAFLVDQISNQLSTICTWNAPNQQMRTTFARQALPMTWDYAESNPFCSSSGSFHSLFTRMVKGFAGLADTGPGFVRQADASAGIELGRLTLISTDPPYYDNIGYSDLSDYFYIWLQRSLSKVFPGLFSTILAPKSNELVASPYRYGGDKGKAQASFETGLQAAFRFARKTQPPQFPATFYYAFKQSESDESGTASTGWEAMLEGLASTGFQITGTWPMRTEKKGRAIEIGANALASSIVLVCRPRPDDAPVTTRKDFIRQLEKELPSALATLQEGNIAPVDFAQAAIGPGMGIFSRYSKVLDASGEPMRVREALVLINQQLYEFLNEGMEELDSETQFALSWFMQFQYNEGLYGEAEVLGKGKNISVEALVDSGIAFSKAGKVRLLERSEYDHEEYDPTTDPHLNAWEVMQRMIWALEHEGVKRPAQILQAMGGLGETARELAYRMYQLCDSKKWSKEALAYNTLVQNWTDIEAAKQDIYDAGYQPGLGLRGG